MNCLKPTAQEKAYFSQSWEHRLQIHRKGSNLLWSLFILSFLVSSLFIIFDATFNIQVIQISVAAILTPLAAFCFWMTRPCACGKTLLLNRAGRANAARNLKLQLLRIACMSITSALLVSVVLLSPLPFFTAILGDLGVNLWLSTCVLTVAGAALYGFILQKFPCSRETVMISPKWYGLDESTLDETEYHELIPILIESGRFEDADLYSKRLLSLVEKGRQGAEKH